MITLKTDCTNCIHSKVCKNYNEPKNMYNKLKDLRFGTGPNDDYDWNTMSESYRVNIDVSCKDCQRQVSTPRERYGDY